METFNITDNPHRRYNPLTGEWLLVSPHRAKRPWMGQVEKHTTDRLPVYDPDCYLCPGNRRAGGKLNPKYNSTFLFTNDFSSLLTETPEGCLNENELFVAESEHGVCKVICFSPRHDLAIPLMEVKEIKKVVEVWIAQYREMGNSEIINHVQIFENKGSIMGCSNPHPHCQIWAQKSLPVEVAKEQTMQTNYYDRHYCTLISAYLESELEKKVRIVCKNESFVALVPFWAVWPFELMVISRRQIGSIALMHKKEITDLADIYKQLTIRYDNLFETSFPYSMGIHQAPTDGKNHPEWHLHMHFYPPLLRSAAIRKFMVGYELLAEPQRDITAEQSAKKLRTLSSKHYAESVNPYSSNHNEE